MTGRLSRPRARTRLTSAAERSLPSPGCFAGSSRRRLDDAPDETDATTSAAVGPGSSGEPDLAALPIVGITRRRAAILLGALLAGWIVILFARQVSEASAATGRAETMVADNAARRSEIAGLERELQRIQQQRFVVQQARGYGLGGPGRSRSRWARAPRASRPMHPGSAGLRVGAHDVDDPARQLADAPVRPRRLT